MTPYEQRKVSGPLRGMEEIEPAGRLWWAPWAICAGMLAPIAYLIGDVL